MATQTQSGYLNLDGGKLYYEVAGEGQPLLLAHAGFVDSGMWDAQWQAFSAQYRAIRYDMRGYGKSDPLPAPVVRREELEQLLDHLGVERAALLGSSLGGEIVVDFTLEHPDRVWALIPVSAVPGGFEMQGAPPRYVMDMIAALQQDDFERVSDLQIRIWVDGMYREPEQVEAKVRQHAAAMNRIAVQNRTWGMDAEPPNPLDPPAAGRLGSIGVPTLVIAGALDHPELLRAAAVMAGAIKGAKKVIIDGAAHVPNMEHPATFNRAVLDFLGALR